MGLENNLVVDDDGIMGNVFSDDRYLVCVTIDDIQALVSATAFLAVVAIKYDNEGTSEESMQEDKRTGFEICFY